MGWLFTGFAYAAGYIAVMFLAFAVACGMYYLADLAEEYPTLTRKVLKYCIVAAIGCHILLWVFEGLPFFFILVGLGSHVAYYMLLNTFPMLNYLSIEFVVSGVGLVLSHIVWLWHFTSRYYYPVGQKMAFFFICVWLVPFGFCLSLSVNDNVLPGNADGSMAGSSKRSNMCKRVLDVFRSQAVLPTAVHRRRD